MVKTIKRTDAEWKKILSPEAYQVLRQKGTEAPFSGEYVHIDETGDFRCLGCGNLIFESDKKFDSGTGWPSFYDAIEGSVVLKRDLSHGMDRTEVLCSQCGGHLGHVFDDGPAPTGKRYCINCVAMKFEPKN
jgi:peptide-methionine (R)-S-oxide reductase